MDQDNDGCCYAEATINGHEVRCAEYHTKSHWTIDGQDIMAGKIVAALAA